MLVKKAPKAQRIAWRGEKSAKFIDREFVTRQVIPLIPRLSEGNGGGGWRGEIVRALVSTGRMTVRYMFPGHGVVYGKAHFNPSLSCGEYEILRYLWLKGFGPPSRYQVPEPLGLIPEEHMLLMGEARGVPLSDLLAAGPMEEAVRGARAAARWLVKFHALEIPGLEVEPPVERIKVIRLASLLAKVAAANPEQVALIVDLLQRFRSVAPLSNTPLRLVPSHLQYRPTHIFVDGEDIIVIDLDKVWLSDPAKDVALFMQKMKNACFETDGDVERADFLANEFAKEYRALTTTRLLNLPYFRALYCLKGLGRAAKEDDLEPEKRQAMRQLYLAEFERCLQESPE